MSHNPIFHGLVVVVVVVVASLYNTIGLGFPKKVYLNEVYSF